MLLFAGMVASPAKATTCSNSFFDIQTLIDEDIVAGVVGGIKATTVNSLMTIQNACYVNSGKH